MYLASPNQRQICNQPDHNTRDNHKLTVFNGFLDLEYGHGEDVVNHYCTIYEKIINQFFAEIAVSHSPPE